MDPHHQLLARLAQQEESKLVLLVLDGVGDIVTESQGRTALQAASTPNLDRLAARSALGRIVPVAQGVTPGSGPGHLALFGYDPARPENDIGRGVLEALGLGLELEPGQVAARGNFATADAAGRLTDRRAGRIPTEENRRICAALDEQLQGRTFDGARARVFSGEGHRFVLLLDGDDLSPQVADTDPQETGVPPLPPRATGEAAERTAQIVADVLAVVEPALAGMAAERLREEPENTARANRVLLRGFATLPHLPSMEELYKLRCGAFAGYPLYRGVAAACGMAVFPCGKRFADAVETAAAHWRELDYFFLHVKQTDMAGEDGDLAAKVAVLEEVDRDLPRLLELAPDVLAITGDHSTPAPVRQHSWHPVPLLLHGPHCFMDAVDRFDEIAVLGGHLGTFPSHELIGLMLANAGRLAKYGA